MADETKIEEKTAAVVDAVAAPVKAVAAKVEAIAAAPVKTVKTAVRARRARKAPAKLVKTVTKTNKRAAKPARRTVKAATAATAAQIKRTNDMNYDFTKMFAGFQMPGADKFQDLVADAGVRGQEFAAKSQAATQEMTDIAKANVEALVEAGRIATAGAKSIGQDVLASGRDGIEQASDAVKTLAEAKSPTEFFQLQSELVRSSFDRFVAESSKLTEQVVKLAGDAIQPISNRASVNAERINELVA